jgi:LuxR family maltose regulon positive regulatory protein
MGRLYSCLLSGEVTLTVEQQIRTVVPLGRASNHFVDVQNRIILLARLYRLQGRLRAAATLYEEAGQATPGDFFQALGARALYCFGLGELWREWNRLDEAERLLAQGLEEVREAVSTFAEEVLFGHLTLARLLQARGTDDRAIATLDAFLQVAELRRFVPQLKATGAAVRAQIELARGNRKAALAWVQTSGLSVDDAELPYPREREYLTLARVCIAEGRANPASPSLPDALRLLNRLLENAQASTRLSSALEILILQALALHAHKDLQGALTTLRRALALAEPEEYIRLFVDEGAPMRELLRQALSRGITPHYIARLLAAGGEPVDGAEVLAPAPPGSLIEPLTKREREVLYWLSEGASNREIADRLVVSTGTIKKHVYNICSKLGVQSRTQALARARALRLL